MDQRTLSLTEAQRAELERTRDTDRRPYLREYAAALLQIAEGHSPHAVATGPIGLHKRRAPDTVYRWLNQYQQGGLAALVHRPRGHRGFSPRRGGATYGPDPAAS